MSYGTLHTRNNKVYLLDVSTQLHETYCTLSEKLDEDKFRELTSFELSNLLDNEYDQKQYKKLLRLGVDSPDAIFSFIWIND